MKNHKTSHIRMLTVAIVIGLGLSLVYAHKTYAFSLATVPNSQKILMDNYDNDKLGNSKCYHDPNGTGFEEYQQLRWVSPSGNTALDSSTTAQVVKYGTKSVQLQINTLDFLCSKLVVGGIHYATESPPTAAASLSSTWTHIIGISSTVGSDNISGPAVGGYIVNTKNASSRWWGINSKGFTYTRPTGFINNTIVTVTAHAKVANFYGSKIICVENGATVTLVDQCPTTDLKFDLKINIQPDTPPQILVSNPTCSSTSFNVNSYDKDSNTSNDSYSIGWRVYTLSGGIWVIGESGSTGNVYGKDSHTEQINFTPSIPNPALPHFMYVFTNGYGIPHFAKDESDPLHTATKGSWGPCGGNNFSFLPTVNPTTDDPLNESPTKAIFGSGIDNLAGVAVKDGINLQRTFTIIHSGITTTVPNNSPGNSGALLSMGTGDRDFVPYVSYNFAANGISLKAGDKICAKETIYPATGTRDPTTLLVTSAGGPASTPNVCIPIVDIPYAKWFGGDILAGGKFGDTAPCSNDDAGIFTFYDSRAGRTPAGSGVQFAAFAMDQISRFTSSLGSTSPPTRLSFSNTNGLSPPIQLGGFFGGDNCIHNYMDDAASANQINTTTLSQNINALGNDTYYYTPPGGVLTLNSSGMIGKGKNTYLYVTGDVYINDNIDYDTSWSNENDIQYLQIVTDGNIFISPNVTTLDGVYIASNPGAGTIYTCAPNGAETDPGASPAVYLSGGPCHTKLLVNGTFIANKIKLLRTVNSLRDSNSAADLTFPETSGNSKSAELFLFDPSMYIGNTCRAAACGAAPPDTTITSLPPIL